MLFGIPTELQSLLISRAELLFQGTQFIPVLGLGSTSKWYCHEALMLCLAVASSCWSLPTKHQILSLRPTICWLQKSVLNESLTLGNGVFPFLASGILCLELPAAAVPHRGDLLFWLMGPVVSKYEVRSPCLRVWSSQSPLVHAVMIPSGLIPEPTRNEKRIFSVCVDESPLDKTLPWVFGTSLYISLLFKSIRQPGKALYNPQ